MAEAWLTEEWVASVAASVSQRPPAPGVDGEVRWVIAAAAAHDVVLAWHYRAGQPSWLGSPSPGRAAEVTFTLPQAEARALLGGESQPSVAFMRGRLKTAGDPGLVLALLASTATPAWEAWRAGLDAATADGAR
ncbi:MAG: SCP2 sterol-binding domain-containing protein [Acidimicrobiales bacterium]